MSDSEGFLDKFVRQFRKQQSRPPTLYVDKKTHLYLLDCINKKDTEEQDDKAEKALKQRASDE